MKKDGQSWDLKELNSQSIESAFKEIETKTKQIEHKKNLLTNNITNETFLDIVKEIENLRITISHLTCFASLRFAEDSSNQRALAEMTAIDNFITKIGNRLLFFSLWFKDLPESKSKELIRVSGKYAYYFELIWKSRKYTLKENEEKIINIKNSTGISALNNIYNILTTQFSYQFRGKKITQEELSNKVRNHSAQVRKEAYLTLLSKYKENVNVIGEIYKNIINDWREEDINLRGHDSPIQVRNFANDIPDEAVEALLNICEKNQHLFQKFFEIKRKKLGLKKMTRFDLYANVEVKKEKNISYTQGLQMVLDTYQEFSPRFKEAALKIVNSNHIHSQIQKNKQTGAFCCGISTKLPPFVLLNYTGTLRDVSTIAHELGHGVHYILASEQTEFTHDASLPLAETASIFAEMLLTEKMMKEDPTRAKELLYFKLEDIYASVIRQAGFVMFEKKAHEMIAEGKTIDELNTAYLSDLKKQLGSKVQVDPIFAYEWAYIPHIFHTPFYCYSYAFGNLLVLSLWEMYQEKGPSFAEKIIEMLAKGSSQSPIEITKAIGVDICSEEFWQKGFDVIERMIKEVE